MQYEVLYEKYIKLKKENEALKIENEQLLKYFKLDSCENNIKNHEEISVNTKLEVYEEKISQIEVYQKSIIKNTSTPEEKIMLFMSLFKGRNDVYAKRWENKAGKAGYSPVCINEWNKWFCNKPRVKCSQCDNRKYAELDNDAINRHLRGKEVLGIYPMLEDETCYFLAIDFDDDGWEKDVTTIIEVCKEKLIPFGVERSRSGNGAHIWFFFNEKISATVARKFGTAILTYAMDKRHEIKFKSYDRLFPNQDTMPKGGLGNLVALPLQKNARKNNNSVFIDENFQPYEDQWGFLTSISKITKEDIDLYNINLAVENDLGTLMVVKDETIKPWEQLKADTKLISSDFPRIVNVVKANMLYIHKDGFSNKVLNKIKRLAAFKNPEFYKAQGMRLPTFDKPRIISLSDETDEYICIPRGCEEEFLKLLNSNNINIKLEDKTYVGTEIKVQFNGELRLEQSQAVEELLKYDNGVLSATTAFGKTVIGADLIAEKKVNTLIIVHTKQLLEQWLNRLEEFLIIDEVVTDNSIKKKGRKKIMRVVGQFGGGKNRLSGIIDIATMQSLVREGEVKELVKDYGMVIVDECHHVSAFSLEKILKSVNAKYIYGLTATPIRKDGHDPIIFMQCGPIRYKVDPIKQALKRPFDHYIIPRFTPFNVQTNLENKELTIVDIYSQIVESEIRNKIIIDDVIECVKEGRNPIILTERTAHVKKLSEELKKQLPDVITLTGAMSDREKKEEIDNLQSIPIESNIVIVATGKFVGEGFDEPRLDTLFLAMPISWKGTLQQYVGRIHRLYENKNEVQVYDYVDVHVRVLEKMYQKRIKGYSTMGYWFKSNNKSLEKVNSIYNSENFSSVYNNDILSAKKELVIASPFISKVNLAKILEVFKALIKSGIKIIIITRPLEELKEASRKNIKDTYEILNNQGIHLVFKNNMYKNFAVIDDKIVWYGSINLLSYGSSEESVMRLESIEIANELLIDCINESNDIAIQQRLI